MTTVYPQAVYGSQQPPTGGYVAYGAPPHSGYPPPQGYPAQGQPPQGYAAPGYYPPPVVPGAVEAGAYNAYGGMPPQQGIPPGAYNPAYQQPPLDAYNAAYAQPPPGGYNQAYAQQAPSVGYAVAIPVNDTYVKQTPDPANTVETGRWSVGLCDCCNNCFPNLCMSWCCPCVSLAQIYARIALSSYRSALCRFGSLIIIGLIVQYAPIHTPSADDWELVQDQYGNYYYVQKGVIIAALIPIFVWILVQVLFTCGVCFARGRVRQRFQIPGNPCCDCLISWLCSCCAIAQMASHVKSYKPGSCDFGGPDVLPAYSG